MSPPFFFIWEQIDVFPRQTSETQLRAKHTVLLGLANLSKQQPSFARILFSLSYLFFVCVLELLSHSERIGRKGTLGEDRRVDYTEVEIDVVVEQVNNTRRKHVVSRFHSVSIQVHIQHVCWILEDLLACGLHVKQAHFAYLLSVYKHMPGLFLASGTRLWL